jgi:hypothetical protein
LERWVNLVENNCDPDREAQFNDWYDNMHVPDALGSPGIVRARRYQTREFRDGRAKYLALYDIETDDIDETMRVRLAIRAEEVKRGRASSCFPNLSFSLWRDVLWRELSERRVPGNATGEERWLSLVESNCDPAREREFDDWSESVQVPDALKTPGYVAARRLRIKEFREGRGKYIVIHEIETGDIEETVRVRGSRPAAAAPGLERPLWREFFWKQITDRKQTRVGEDDR